MSWDDFGGLLAQQGDVIVLTPLTQPAPTPTPPVPPAPGPADDADRAMWPVAVHWLGEPWWRRVENEHVLRAALAAWAAKKGLTP